MKRLLQLEFIKLWNSKISRIIIYAYFILICSLALIAAIKFDIGPIKFHLAEQGIFNFPYIWHLNTFFAAFFKVFLAIIIVSMTANEYSYKTIKQNLIDGLSKKEFLLSKVYMAGVFSLISTAFIFLISLILGLVYSDYNELGIIFSDLSFILAFFVKLFSFFSFCLFAGVLVKKSAYALGFMVIWQMFEGFIRGMIRWKLFDEATTDTIMGFFPLNSMWNLIKQPFTRFEAVQTVAQQIGEEVKLNYYTSLGDFITAILWAFIFIYLSYFILKKRDL